MTVKHILIDKSTYSNFDENWISWRQHSFSKVTIANMSHYIISYQHSLHPQFYIAAILMHPLGRKTSYIVVTGNMKDIRNLNM